MYPTVIKWRTLLKGCFNRNKGQNRISICVELPFEITPADKISWARNKEIFYMEIFYLLPFFYLLNFKFENEKKFSKTAIKNKYFLRMAQFLIYIVDVSYFIFDIQILHVWSKRVQVCGSLGSPRPGLQHNRILLKKTFMIW